MNKQDLTQYSSAELSLNVFNDESLYNQMHCSDFKELIGELFIYTDEQWDELQEDLEADLEEA